MNGEEICPEIPNQCHQCTLSPSTEAQFRLLMRHTPYGLWSKNRNTLTHAQTYVLRTHTHTPYILNLIVWIMPQT